MTKKNNLYHKTILVSFSLTLLPFWTVPRWPNYLLACLPVDLCVVIVTSFVSYIRRVRVPRAWQWIMKRTQMWATKVQTPTVLYLSFEIYKNGNYYSCCWVLLDLDLCYCWEWDHRNTITFILSLPT